jgi:hypothetical protein
VTLIHERIGSLLRERGTCWKARKTKIPVKASDSVKPAIRSHSRHLGARILFMGWRRSAESKHPERRLDGI